MSKYKEESKTIYTRAESIIINNCLPSGGLNPSLRFNEEYAIVNADGTIVSLGPTGTYVMEELTSENTAEEFNLLDANDNVTGTATFADVQIMLRSLYKYASVKRDNTPVIPDEPVELPPEWPTMNIDQPADGG
jgi:hypothetical protein